jgi:hypothetical protein
MKRYYTHKTHFTRNKFPGWVWKNPPLCGRYLPLSSTEPDIMITTGWRMIIECSIQLNNLEMCLYDYDEGVQLQYRAVLVYARQI